MTSEYLVITGIRESIDIGRIYLIVVFPVTIELPLFTDYIPEERHQFIAAFLCRFCPIQGFDGTSVRGTFRIADQVAVCAGIDLLPTETINGDDE